MTLLEECPRHTLTLDVTGCCPRQDCDYSRPRLSQTTCELGLSRIDQVRAQLEASTPKAESPRTLMRHSSFIESTPDISLFEETE